MCGPLLFPYSLRPVTALNENDSHLHPPALALCQTVVGGVALELGQKGGAHSPIPEISLKLFLLQTNNTALWVTVLVGIV